MIEDFSYIIGVVSKRLWRLSLRRGPLPGRVSCSVPELLHPALWTMGLCVQYLRQVSSVGEARWLCTLSRSLWWKDFYLLLTTGVKLEILTNTNDYWCLRLLADFTAPCSASELWLREAICAKKTVELQTLSVTAPTPPLVADNLFEYVWIFFFSLTFKTHHNFTISGLECVL